MRFSMLLVLGALPAMVFALGQGNESVESLIRKLGSTNFQERQVATKALEERPEFAPALRAALRSPDREIARRAGEILERGLVREINGVIKEGRMDRIIDIFAGWPEGKQEKEAWDAARELARTLANLSQKNGQKQINPLERWGDKAPIVISAERITEMTKANMFHPCFFLRANQVDVDIKRLKGAKSPNPFSTCDLAIVASGSVRMFAVGGIPIFAGGNVNLSGEAGGCLIVSGGDVHIDSILSNSLVIARGNVTCTSPMTDSRVFSGKSVFHKRTQNCLISENDPNPLGFIRWADAPKDKGGAKSK